MKTRSFTADKLDIPAFAIAGATLEGEAVLQRMARLRASLHPETAMDALDTPVTWLARGEARPRTGGAPELWVHLQVTTVATLTCQRCLGRVDEALTLNSSFHFVDNEALAAELDADADDDVLVISRSFDLLELIEDELLLALPLAPGHVVCPQAPPAPIDDHLSTPTPAPEPDVPTRRPFAGLAALRKPGPKG